MSNFLTGNRGKLLLAGVLLVAAAWLVYRSVDDPGALPDDIPFVCVETGERFWVDRDDLTRIPSENPRTGQMTLLPCTERDGVVFVTDRYAGSLMKLGERNRYVDIETLAVRSTQ